MKSEKGETLEDFVENYIKNKKAASYAEWVERYGTNTERNYSDAIRSANADYRLARSEYGSVAERLGDMGLTANGYSDYLNGKAYSVMQEKKKEAKSDYAEGESANRIAYESYIEKLVADGKETYDGTVERITSAKISDYDEAYEYALAAGLSEKAAASAAREASGAVARQIKEAVMKTVINRSLTETQTREYALSLGLGEEDAAELAEYAKAINGYAKTSGDYLKYLKEKAEKASSK